MTKKIPYVHSSFERKPDDDYKTIDPRCVYGFLGFVPHPGTCVDVCAPNGSGIVDTLLECGVEASCARDAFSETLEASWIVTNPPYTRPLVDEIILRQIKRIEDCEVVGVAMLLRNNFDHAKSRMDMFRHELYAGQIKLCFRPWWSESRDKQPIHNFIWHLWMGITAGVPIVYYAYGEKPC